MTERIPVMGDNFPARFIKISADLAGKHKLLHGKLHAEVTLTVDGEAVPVLESLVAWEREVDALVQARARELAVQLVSEAGLAGAMQAIQQANLTVKRVVGEAFDRLRTDEGYVERTS